MLTRLLVAGSFIAAGMLAASAQTTVPPGAPPAPSAVPVISDATHCRDANGMVRLKVGARQDRHQIRFPRAARGQVLV
jgi:hypothetical protein